MDFLEHLTKQELFCSPDMIRRVLKPHGFRIAQVPNAEGSYGMRVRYGDMTHEQAFTTYCSGSYACRMMNRQFASW
jgi:hypothetical protein